MNKAEKFKDINCKLENKFGLSLNFMPEHGTCFFSYNGENWLGSGILSIYAGGRWYMSQHHDVMERGDLSQQF